MWNLTRSITEVRQAERHLIVNMSNKPIGRPSIYTEELAFDICEQLAQGKSLVKICNQDAMPGITTVWRWIDNNEVFRGNYARAREAQADFFADEINDIADLSTAEDVQVSKLRIDARKWTTSKLRPKKYGDKLDVTAVTTTQTHEQWLATLK